MHADERALLGLSMLRGPLAVNMGFRVKEALGLCVGIGPMLVYALKPKAPRREA